MRRLFSVLIALLSGLASAKKNELISSELECGKNYAHIVVKLLASESAKETGWNLVDNDGAKILGQSDGYGESSELTPYEYSTCVRRSVCGGDGGDGKLILSITGNGAFDSYSLFLDDVEELFSVGYSGARSIAQCIKRSPSHHRSHVKEDTSMAASFTYAQAQSPSLLRKAPFPQKKDAPPPPILSRDGFDELSTSRGLQEENSTISIQVRSPNENIEWQWSLRDTEGVEVYSDYRGKTSLNCLEEPCIIDASECYSFTYSGDSVNFKVSTTGLGNSLLTGSVYKMGLLVGQGCVDNFCKQKPSLDSPNLRDKRSRDIMERLLDVTRSNTVGQKPSQDFLGTEEIESSQYQAACWVLYEDPFRTMVTDVSFMQRYVLRLFYLYYEHNVEAFLENVHECNWHPNIHCDERSDIISEINFEGESLAGGFFRTLLPEFGELKFLKVLNLRGTGLGGGFHRKLTYLQNLEVLDLGENQLVDRIPQEIGKMISLKKLELHNTLIEGQLQSIYNLTNLEILNLTNNFLGGTIETDIGNMLKLEKLDLSFNQFTGEVPGHLLNAISLREIVLSSNRFTGKLPLIRGKVKNPVVPKHLSRMILGNNEFESSIPKSIELMKGLKELRLENNKLSGRIPEQLGNLKHLELMSLHYNQLIGTIPSEFINMKNLTRVYLHGNQLVGTADFIYSPQEYITDCGFPSVTGKLLLCDSCTICCNSREECQSNQNYTVGALTPLEFTLVMSGGICGFYIFLFLISYVMRSKVNHRYILDALELSGSASVYHFVICDTIMGWLVVLTTLSFQITIFYAYLKTSSFEDKETSDWVYAKRCPPNGLECEDDDDTTTLGWISLFLVMLTYLMTDIVKGSKLIFRAGILSSLRLFVAGIILLIITVLAILSSYFYNRATALSNTEIILNSVILLFTTDIDEWVHRLLFYLHPKWLEKMMHDARCFQSNLDGTSDEKDDESNIEPQIDSLTKNPNHSFNINPDNAFLRDHSFLIDKIEMSTSSIQTMEDKLNAITDRLNKIESGAKKSEAAQRRRSTYADLVVMSS